jgi:flagellar biogenesis protein FliO
MDSLLGSEGSLIVRFVVAFVIVLGLIGLTFWLIRRFGTARVGAAAQRGRQPRLAVIDAAPVDGRRRLVLIRRDNVEHLLMIGGPSDVVVEQNIVRAVPVNAPRDVPVPRQPEGRPENVRPLPLDEEQGWTPPEPAPVQRPAFQPRPARAPAPSPYLDTPPPREPVIRPPLPASLAPMREPAPIAPAMESEAGAPDATLANMAQRLEAALRRPGADAPTRSQPIPRPEPELEHAEPPATAAPDLAPQNGDTKPAKPPGPPSKSVLDSLEQEMASLLGRPPEKQ